jgi:plastocyanin
MIKLLGLFLAISLVAVACGGDDDNASAGTNGSAATQPPAATTSAPTTVAVTASNFSFDKPSISVPRNTQVTVNFTNSDANTPHDFGVSVPGTSRVGICTGPCTGSITFSSGAPGAFVFNCNVHPTMTGTFTVT